MSITADKHRNNLLNYEIAWIWKPQTFNLLLDWSCKHTKHSTLELKINDKGEKLQSNSSYRTVAQQLTCNDISLGTQTCSNGICLQYFTDCLFLYNQELVWHVMDHILKVFFHSLDHKQTITTTISDDGDDMNRVTVSLYTHFIFT
jgi:hypothetical protein